MEAYLHSVDSDSDDCDSFCNKLARGVDKVLIIRDVHGKQGASDDDDSEVEENNELRGHAVRWKKFNLSSSDEDGELESAKESLRKIYEHAMSLPSPVNLVSALKGSREKDSGSQRKVTVTWAPDVYDPPPTDLELILKRGSKQQKVPKKEKKTGKKALKGKDFSRGSSSSKESSRGGGKDKKKKQHRGAGRGSRRHDVFADDGDDGIQSLSYGVPDSAHGSSSNKAASHWSSKDKKKLTRGMGGKVRRYDLPPSDSDEDEEAEVGSGDKKKQTRGKGGKVRRYDLPPSESEEDEEVEVKSVDKKKQTRGTNENIRRYDLPPSDSDEDKEAEAGVRGKKKQTGGIDGNVRRYDMPPSDSDEDEEPEAGNMKGGSPDSHCSNNNLKGSLKEMHYSVAKAL